MTKYGMRLTDITNPIYESVFHAPKDFGYRTDNPSREACLQKRKSVEAAARDSGGRYGEGLAAKSCTGWPTANMGIWKPMYVPVNNLLHLDGANNEQHYRKAGDSKFDSLANSVTEKGWLDIHPVMVRVNHHGIAYVVEGNTRIRIAAQTGVRYIRAQFEWMNGAEEDDGPWSPQTVAEISLPQPPINEARDPWKFYGHESDEFSPRLMEEPKVLYRSVSLYELEDIFSIGKVRGGQNKFNEFDRRRWVFFADEITEQLIRQGEEIERQAVHALSGHSSHRAFRHLTDEIETQGTFILGRMESLGVEFDEGYREAFGQGEEVSTMEYAVRMCRHLSNHDREWFDFEIDKLYKAHRERHSLQNEYREALKAKHAEMKTAAVSMEATSAIIVTKPLMGGLHYSKEFGKSGFETSEYGFHPNQVTTQDITEVMFVKDGHIVGKLPPEKVLATVRKILGV